MTTTPTVVTINATAFGEFLERMATSAETLSSDPTYSAGTREFFSGSAVAYRGALATLTDQIELGADGFLVVDHA